MKGGIPHWSGYRWADIRTRENPPHAPIPIGDAIASRRHQPDRQKDEAKQTRPAGNTLAGEITINLFDPDLHGMLRTLGVEVADGLRGNLENETDATHVAHDWVASSFQNPADGSLGARGRPDR